MREVAIVGVGMTRFAKHLDKGMKELSREAIEAAQASKPTKSVPIHWG